MENSEDKKKTVLTERIIDILCLAVSYGILILLPQTSGLFFYLIFGASAFLFCIGFFRLGLTFDELPTARGQLLAGLFFAVFGILINSTGVILIHQEEGSGRSIMIATMLMIEALVLYAMAGSAFQTEIYQRYAAIVFQTAAVLLTVSGVGYMIAQHFSGASVIIATFLLIESICLWGMYKGNNPFNTLNPEIQTVPGLRVPIEQLQQSFSGVQTQLGYPWIGKVKTVKQDAIIYGPSEDGFVVYGYYLYGRFHVAGSTNPLFPEAEDAQGHIVAEVPDSNGNLMNKDELMKAYVNMFARYVENGTTRW